MQLKETIEKPINYYRHWRYKNSTLLVISIAVLYYFADSSIVSSTVNHMGNLGYLGAFVSGILFVSVFTIAPSAVVLFRIAETYNPFIVAIVAGFGAVIGDYLIFRYLKDRVFEELHPLVIRLGSKHLVGWFSTPHFSWLIPFIGAFVIASPIPDEIGIGMLGLSKVKNWQFLAISFGLNSIGILLTIIFASMYR